MATNDTTVDLANAHLDNLVLGIAVCGGVFALYYVVAILSRRATHDTADLYVAGRTIGPLVNSLAAASTWMSVATFLGAVALIQVLNMPFVYMWSQLVLSVPLLVLFYGAFMWRLGMYTPVSFVRARYGDGLGVVAAVWMLLILLMYMIGQFVGTAKVFEVLLGLPYTPSLIASAIVITVYITIGGMKGATYNDAIQMVIMMLTLMLPLAAILQQLGATGFWIPPLGYGNLTDAALEAVPAFFDLKFEPRFYLALFVALTLGIMSLPQLAQRVMTASDIKSARRIVPWFCFWVGAMFTGIYAVGFAGAVHFAQLGVEVPREVADKTTLLLNLAFNPDWVSAFVVAGVLAAGVSTIAGLMLSVATIVGHDILQILKPSTSQQVRFNFGYIALGVTGVVSLIISLNPPDFLITSIFWAFGLGASAVTPMILLGCWSTRINGPGCAAGSVAGGILYIALTPQLGGALALGPGNIISVLGFAAALVTVPIGFIVTIIGSLVAERIEGMVPGEVRSKAQDMVERLHGWNTVSGTRYADSTWLLVLCALWVPVLIWGLMPW